MRFSAKSIVCAALSICALSANAQISHSKQGDLITIKYTKGQTLRYNLSMEAKDLKRAPTKVQIITQCLSIAKDGTATLKVSTPAGPGKPPYVRNVVIDKHGKPLGQRLEGFSGNFMWPNKPIKPGQTWKGDMNMAAAGQGQGDLKATYKYEGIKKINGKPVAVISTYMDLSGEYNIAGTGKIYVRVADGQLDNAIFNMGMMQTSESGKPSTLRLLMSIRTQF